MGQANIAHVKETPNLEYSNSSGSKIGGMNKEEVERLCSFPLNKPIASCSLEQLGKYFMTHALNVPKDCLHGPWIIRHN